MTCNQVIRKDHIFPVISTRPTRTRRQEMLWILSKKKDLLHDGLLPCYLKDHLFPIISTQPTRTGRQGVLEVLSPKEVHLVRPRRRIFSMMVPFLLSEGPSFSQIYLLNPPEHGGRECYRFPLLREVHLIRPRGTTFSMMAPSLWNSILAERRLAVFLFLSNTY